MDNVQHAIVKEKAIEVLTNAASAQGITASAQLTDNYNRIWARDVVVTGLAILTNELTELYEPFHTSLKQLQKAAANNGQIPSNISVDHTGFIQAVSFGGPVGRTDCNFWWMIGSIAYLQQHIDEAFKNIVYAQSEKIIAIADTWEFNHKGLMYLPVSSNWADEYVTGGYVLYDQLLRFWALSLAGDFYEKPEWTSKAAEIKLKLKQHFCFEMPTTNALFTESQKQQVNHFDITAHFLSSFSPTQLIQKYDSWSIALMLMLDIPSAETKNKLIDVIQSAFETYGNKGIPAFWPPIVPGDELYAQLTSNYSYRFKNKPGHFHNGGIWPVTNGFLITALFCSNAVDAAILLQSALEKNLCKNLNNHPFAEYFDLENGAPNGVSQLCFSASGYLLANKAKHDVLQIKKVLGLKDTSAEISGCSTAENLAKDIYNHIAIDNNKVMVVSIAGESGCGKTTLSVNLKKTLEANGHHVFILHQDDYFKLPPRKNHEQRLIDFNHIGTDEVELGTLDKDIHIIKNKLANSLLIPVMNWASDTKEIEEKSIGNTNIILVDGTYTSLLKNVDIRIFMNANYQSTKTKRIARNREVVTDFIERVLHKESDIIQQHQHMADIIIDEQYSIIYR